MKKYKITIAMLCIFLIVSLPIVSAQFYQPNVQGAGPFGPFYSDPNPYSNPASYQTNQLRGGLLGGYTYNDPFADAVRRQSGGYSYGFEQNLGEAIIINVADYEPKQVRQSLLEQQDSPVFFYLKGTTLGTVLSPFTKDPSSKDIFSGITEIPKIDYIEIRPNISSQYYRYIRDADYIQPKRDRTSLDNMGYLIVYLKKLESGNATPPDNNIILDFNAKIYLNLEDSTLFGVSQQDLALKVMTDEKEFLKNKDESSFFSGKGFMRATAVTPESVTIQVYNKELYPISLATFSRDTNPTSQGLQPRTTMRLTKGQTSHPISFGYTGNSLLDFFQIKLDDVATPQDRAELEFESNGKIFSRKVPVGAKLFSKSPWIVKRVDSREWEKITTINLDKTAKEFSLDEEDKKILTDYAKIPENERNEKSQNDVNGNLAVVRHIVDIENQLTDEIKTISKDVISLNGKPLNIEAPIISDSTAEALESKYCPVGEDKEDIACKAVVRYKKLIKEYPKVREAKLAMNDLVDIYEKKLIEWSDCLIKNKKQINIQGCSQFHSDMLKLAQYYDFKADNKDKLNQRFKTKGEPEYIAEDGLFVDLKQVEKIDLKAQGETTIQISAEGLFESKDFNPTEDLFFNNPKLNDINNVALPISIDDVTKNKKEWEWRAEKVSPNAVTIRLYNKKNNNPAPSDKSSPITLKLNELTDVPVSYEYTNPVTGIREGSSKIVQLKATKIDTKYEAYVTLIPGTGKSFTTSNFKINIPIDPRPFKWTPEMLEDHIKTTKKIIEQLDKIIKKMDDIVRTWKKVCLATFAFLTVKSSFLQGTARSLARNHVSDSFKQRCEQEKNEGKTSNHPEFSTIDSCIAHYSDQIKSSVDKTQRHIDEVQEKIKGKTAKELADSGLADEKCGSFKEFSTASINSREQNVIRDYRDCLLFSGLTSDSSIDPSYKKYIEDKAGNINIKAKTELYAKAVRIAKGDKNFDANNLEDLKIIISALQLQSEETQEFKDLTFIVPKLSKTKPGEWEGSAIVKSKSVNVKGLSRLNYLKLNYEENQLDEAVCSDINGIFSNNQCYSDRERTVSVNLEKKKEELSKQQYVYENTGYPIFVDSMFIDKDNIKSVQVSECERDTGTVEGDSCKPKFLASTLFTSDAGFLNTDYSYENELVAFFDNEGLPYCYPVGKGNYAVVDERDSGTKGVKSLRILNVGPNGRIDCGIQGSDDIYPPSGHSSYIDTNPALKNRYTDIERSLRSPCTRDGQPVGKIEGKVVKCSKSTTESIPASLQPKCIDVMDPADCKLLFNACDPVMCPSSRCTLGGKVPPRNVIQSGIIGSTLLCLPNIKDGVAVPVCLTGIDSGLKGIRSILEGYVNCLEIKLKQDKDVAFCDYIRSVGICELVWREAYNVLDIGGRGIIDWASGKLFGETEGGGEYLKFKSSFDNVGKSVGVFTKEYETTYTAQFLSQSTDEIGTQICRLSVNGKLPSVGKIIDQLTEPEDPPQFEAFFDEAPYASPGESFGFATGTFGAKELSLYKVFYHIYAGTGFYRGSYSQSQGVLAPTQNILVPNVQPGQQRPVTYSVYLINRQLGLPPLYVTFPGDFVQYQGTIEPGKYAQQTVQKPAAKGYNEVCVNINGVEQCGFGKVSSSFGIKELNDVITSSEAKKEINSEEECTPNPRRSAGYSLAKIAAASPFVIPGGLTPGVETGLLTSNAEQSLTSTGIVRVCSNQPPTTEPGRWKPVGNCGKDNLNKDLGSCWLDMNSISIDDAEIRGDLLEELEKRGDLKSSVKFLDSEKSKEILVLLNRKRDNLILSLRSIVEKFKREQLVNVPEELCSEVYLKYHCTNVDSNLGEQDIIDMGCKTGKACNNNYCCGGEQYPDYYCCPINGEKDEATITVLEHGSNEKTPPERTYPKDFESLNDGQNNAGKLINQYSAMEVPEAATLKYSYDLLEKSSIDSDIRAQALYNDALGYKNIADLRRNFKALPLAKIKKVKRTVEKTKDENEEEKTKESEILSRDDKLKQIIIELYDSDPNIYIQLRFNNKKWQWKSADGEEFTNLETKDITTAILNTKLIPDWFKELLLNLDGNNLNDGIVIIVDKVNERGPQTIYGALRYPKIDIVTLPDDKGNTFEPKNGEPIDSEEVLKLLENRIESIEPATTTFEDSQEGLAILQVADSNPKEEDIQFTFYRSWKWKRVDDEKFVSVRIKEIEIPLWLNYKPSPWFKTIIDGLENEDLEKGIKFITDTVNVKAPITVESYLRQPVISYPIIKVIKDDKPKSFEVKKDKKIDPGEVYNFYNKKE